MMVEFRLLGTVEMVVDGRPVELGHDRQRNVLAALLVDANYAVPVSELISRVWGDRSPQRARNALSGYLSRLRRALGCAEGVRITRSGPAYVVTVDPQTVDLHRFHSLLVQARKSDDHSAAALRDEALGLWRGPALATLGTPWADSVRRDLEANRLEAVLDRNDFAIPRGRHAELLAELRTLADAHSRNERLVGQLMLALYLCGRQDEALDAYERLRRWLKEEKGTSPIPELRQLHVRILNADPTLAAINQGRRSTHGSDRQPVPRQLPPPLPSFTGRASELAQLDAVLAALRDDRTAMAIIALSGTPGVGKTTLAVHWAHRVADMFEDGQLYVNLRGFDPSGAVMSPAQAIQGFLDAFAIPPHRIPQSLEAQIGLYRSLAAGRRILVVLDNARDLEQVRPLLPGSPGSAVVVTSRNQLSGLIITEGGHPVAVNLPTITEAREMLATRIGHARVAAEPEAVSTIITACAQLPLGLAIVAARAVTHPDVPLASLAAELRDARSTLDVLSTGDAEADVRTVLSWSYHAVTAGAARMFRLLGLHTGPDIGIAAAASLAGVPVTRARALLDELARASLVLEHTAGRYSLHDLLRTYAAELSTTIDNETQRRAAMRRMLDHYLYTADAADRVLYPHRDTIALPEMQPGAGPEQIVDAAQALEWFNTEAPVLLAAVHSAADRGFESYTWQLTWTLVAYLDRQGHWEDWAAAQQIALHAASRLADLTGQATAHRGLAHSNYQLGRYETAASHYRHALNRYRELGDTAGQAQCWLGLSLVAERQGSHTEGLSHAERALALYRAIGHSAGQANALNNIGWYHILLGQQQQALADCQEALAILDEIGNRYGQAATWDSLGYAHHQLGSHEMATTCYRHAIDLFQEQGDRYAQAASTVNLGDAYRSVGDVDGARTAWRRALSILTALDHPDANEVATKLDTLPSG